MVGTAKDIGWREKRAGGDVGAGYPRPTNLFAYHGIHRLRGGLFLRQLGVDRNSYLITNHHPTSF